LINYVRFLIYWLRLFLFLLVLVYNGALKNFYTLLPNQSQENKIIYLLIQLRKSFVLQNNYIFYS
jgi:hypothetical protein